MTAQAHMIGIGAALVFASLLYAAWPGQDGGQAAVEPARAGPDAFAFVRSMEGTRPDGDIRQDAAGQLVIDAELGHLFDYYLAGLGEKDLNAIRMEIERELARRLAAPAAARAKRLLASYLDYKRALAGVEKALPPEADLAKAARARRDAMHRLRPAYFSAQEIAGLFGFGDAYDADALERLDVAQDKTLDAAQKAQRLAALDKKLPAQLREGREAPARVVNTEAAVQQLRKQGAGDDEVYRLRAAAFSPEAAGRLADLDREEADWQRRIALYLAQRSNSGAMDAAALQQLRDKHFSADEQRRLGA
jgi:lipase chaperone LimK